MIMEPAGILVVDDLPEQRLAIEVSLADLGEQVISISSGRDALKYLLDHDVAVILLDVNMPEMDGFETAAMIRHRPRTATTPIIFLTADHDAMQASRGYALGAVDYITCPFLPDVLRTKVKVFVELSRARERIQAEAERRVAYQREQAARAAAEEQNRRMRLLGEAGFVIAGSLDGAPFEEGLLRVLVPTLADEASLQFADETDGSSVWLRYEDEAGPGPTPGHNGISVELTALSHTALVTPGAAVSQHDESGRPRCVALPITMGRTLAILGVARRSRQGYTVEERELLRLIAERTAVALDNRRLYRELQDRDRRKDAFLAMLSHELRNPLGAITSAAHLLGLLGLSDPHAIRAYQIIARQSSYLSRLVDDLLDVSRVTTGRITLSRTVLGLRDLVESTLEVLHASGRLNQRTVVVNAENVHVEVDAARMEQVLTNLVVNAAKYTDAGGQITIEVAAEPHRAVLRVTDDGIGISTDLLPNIFDMFVQGGQAFDRGQGGLGIGLTLVRELVTLHGGTVRAYSDGAGRGSTFEIELPRVGHEMITGKVVRPSIVASSPLRVLLVDDNEDVREMLRDYFTLQKHQVFVASDGPEAVETALRVRPDLALVDLGLPGFDGFEVARRLRGDPRTTGIMLVALTGYGQPEDCRRSAEAGYHAHLVKPVSEDRLSEVVALAMEKSAATDVLDRPVPAAPTPQARTA